MDILGWLYISICVCFYSKYSLLECLVILMYTFVILLSLILVLIKNIHVILNVSECYFSLQFEINDSFFTFASHTLLSTCEVSERERDKSNLLPRLSLLCAVALTISYTSADPKYTFVCAGENSTKTCFFYCIIFHWISKKNWLYLYIVIFSVFRELRTNCIWNRMNR